MPQKFDLSTLTDQHAAMRAVVAALEAGHVVAVPDDVGMLLLALPKQPQACEQLGEISQNRPGVIPLVALAHRSVLEDYVEECSTLASKLARRCWPGPVAFRTGSRQPGGMSTDWCATARDWALTDHGRLFTVPAQELTLGVLGQLSTPAIGAVVPLKAFEQIPTDQLEIVITSNESRFEEGLTVVRIEGGQFEVERSGVVSERILSRLTGEVYIFICTGNTCRSPMAEALFRKMLAEKLGCPDDELLDRGYTIVSAGLAAYPGSPASSEAVRLLKEEGIDLSSHESQPVTEELLYHCDHILTMTHSHLDAILSSLPELSGKVQLLSNSGKDVSDPIGAGLAEYQHCRDEIRGYLKTLLEQQDIT